MTVNGVAGFWSYSHDDDERDGNAVVRLAARVQDEYALVTGEALTLFVDRTQLSWGDEWRHRIDSALAETTFFIPVITPLYFKRDECRRELLSFAGQAESLGAIELIMPILYIDVPGLTESDPDEVRALVARMQYSDWRELRLSDESSSEYRRGVNSLALKLAEINSRYEQSESRKFIDSPDEYDESEEEGLLDISAALEEKLPEWEEFLAKSDIDDKQLSAIPDSYNASIKKAVASGGSGPLLIVLRNFARDAEPAIRRLIEDYKNLSAASIELDPLVLKLLRKLEDMPQVRTGIIHTLHPIESAAVVIMKARQDFSHKDFVKGIAEYKGISKDISRILRLLQVAERYRNDSWSLVLNWHEQIRRD